MKLGKICYIGALVSVSVGIVNLVITASGVFAGFTGFEFAIGISLVGWGFCIGAWKWRY